jgi:hypothetical protein
MQSSLQNNEKVYKCPKCEGLWLAAEIIGNLFDLSTMNDNSRNRINRGKICQPTSNPIRVITIIKNRLLKMLIPSM